jgi:hypothetical protein
MKFSMIRKQNGQSWTGFILALTFLALVPLGILGFELSRLYFAHQQLRSNVDAAVLAGTATLASTDLTSSSAQTQADSFALNAFQSNAILGQSLSAATSQDITSSGTYTPPSPVKIGTSIITIKFVDPNTLKPATVATTGRIMCITGYYGYQLPFGQYFGMGPLWLQATSSGQVPELDIAFCFDVSGSMDDQTPVTFVQRRWTGAAEGMMGLAYLSNNTKTGYGGTYSGTGLNNSIGGNQIDGGIYYSICPMRFSPNNEDPGTCGTNSSQGILYDLVLPPVNGTSLNCIPPQNLSAAADPNDNLGGGNGQFYFTDYTGGTQPNFGMRSNNGAGDIGQPPGNYDSKNPTWSYDPPAGTTAANASYPGYGTNGSANNNSTYSTCTSYGYTFTDLVVNIDGTNYFGGDSGWPYTSSNFSFIPNFNYYGNFPPNSGYVINSTQNSAGGMTYTVQNPNSPYSGNSYYFPNLATLVEAARGNLENQTSWTSCQGIAPSTPLVDNSIYTAGDPTNGSPGYFWLTAEGGGNGYTNPSSPNVTSFNAWQPHIQNFGQSTGIDPWAGDKTSQIDTCNWHPWQDNYTAPGSGKSVDSNQPLSSGYPPSSAVGVNAAGQTADVYMNPPDSQDIMFNTTSSNGRIFPVYVPPPQAGYQAAYREAAYGWMEPLNLSIQSVSTFINLMHTNTNAHLAFIAFTDVIGSSPTSTWLSAGGAGATNNEVDAGYANSPTGTFYLPLYALNLTASDGNYAAIHSCLTNTPSNPGSPYLMPLSATNMVPALTEAISELQNKNLSRPGARKAIILFTDGVNSDVTDYTALSANDTACLKLAQSVAGQIPIYTVGLSVAQPYFTNDYGVTNTTNYQTPIQQHENMLLGDGQNGSSVTGIAGVTKGSYFPVTDASSMNKAFQCIARQLVQLTRN